MREEAFRQKKGSDRQWRDLKIISGGQTGADRAALEFAIAHGIAHGGWCPRGRLAEDGRIEERYHLMETPSDDPIQRTEWNSRDSDATVVFSIAPQLAGGSKKAAELAVKYQKPLLHLSREVDRTEAPRKLGEFLLKHRPGSLNVAGSRHSEEPEVGQFVREVLEDAWTELLKTGVEERWPPR